MREKEIKQEPLREPTQEELEEMSARKEAEMQEFFRKTEDPRMRKIGMAEEFRAREPEETPQGGARPIKKEKGLDLGDYIKKWQEANPDYVFQNLNINRMEIANITNAEMPFEFVDYLIGKAKNAATAKKLDILDEIKQIKIKQAKDAKALVVMVKNAQNAVGIFYFEQEPPFDLKRMESDMGIYTF